MSDLPYWLTWEWWNQGVPSGVLGSAIFAMFLGAVTFIWRFGITWIRHGWRGYRRLWFNARVRAYRNWIKDPFQFNTAILSLQVLGFLFVALILINIAVGTGTSTAKMPHVSDPIGVITLGVAILVLTLFFVQLNALTSFYRLLGRKYVGDRWAAKRRDGYF